MLRNFGVALLIGILPFDPVTAQSPDRYHGPIIDMHLHAYTMEDYWGAIPNPVTGQLSPRSAEEHMERSLEAMRQHNVVLGAVSGSSPDAAEAWHRRERQRVLRALEFGDPTGPFDEAGLRSLLEERRLDVLGEITAQYQGFSPSDPAFDPYWALAQEHGIPVGIHTGASFPGTPYACCPRFRLRLGDPLLLEDLLVKFPDLKVYMMHAGGRQYYAIAIEVMEMYEHVYADVGILSWHPGRTHEAALVSFLKAAQRRGMLDRVLFGSDQMVWPETIGMAIDRINSYDFLTVDEKRGILYDNAARFLGLSPEAIAEHHGR